jgi:predicted esterase
MILTPILATTALLLTPQGGAPKKLIPPPGMAIETEDKSRLETALNELSALLKPIEKHPLYPDAAIFHKAVSWSLGDGTIYNQREKDAAYRLLAEGAARARALARGESPWTKQTELVVRGYRSKLDGSLQPYGLVVPESAFDGGKKRLDIWFHGRGETLTELAFCEQRMRSVGEFAPPGAFVLHPYGRFCNANRLGGEVDVFEGLAAVKKAYSIDDERICVRGFSMGGASTYLFGTRHTDLWAAVAPGAGFSETAEFARELAPGKTPPPQYVQSLWNLYDGTAGAANFFNVPVILYSGENDRQKQAADRMIDALAAENLTVPHVIGKQAGHFYTPDAKIELEKFVTAAAERGRPQNPEKIRFTTFTLRYNKMHWLTVDSLEKHWERARVEGEQKSGTVTLTTKNVAALSLSVSGNVTIDGQALGAGRRFTKGVDGRWRREERAARGLRKIHGLQGPIDDAFMEHFVFVRPTGQPLTAALGAFTTTRMNQAIADWRRYFRGDVEVIDDTKVTDKLAREANLVLWGDPSSNAYLKKIADKLPLRFEKPAETCPVFIAPNPRSPGRYVVVNSGFTWSEYGSGSNATHCPKLPDWATLSLADSSVRDAGFFSERWTR